MENPVESASGLSRVPKRNLLVAGAERLRKPWATETHPLVGRACGRWCPQGAISLSRRSTK
jgi:hypothetical protein